MRYAVMLPGSGSSVDFITRAFGTPLQHNGYALHVVPPATGRDAVRASLDALDAAVARYSPALVGGVSLGAHLAARWAAGHATQGLRGLLLALPAWTGRPGPAAAASAHAAARVEALGTPGALAEAAAHAESWVAAELAAAWPAYGDALAETLRATAASWGPTPDELRRIGVPAAIAAFADDPLHPLAVAEQWAALLPQATLTTLPLAAPAADRTLLGAATLAALPAPPGG
jgi:pimeloyl-ACP methyl ester carboxylesterase